MPDEVGGQSSPDGKEPDNRHHGGADDEFAAVVFDEDFVRSAEVHEPTAVERMLAAAQSHAETEPRPFEDGAGYVPGGEGVPYATESGYAYTTGYGSGLGDDPDHDYDEYEHGSDYRYLHGEDDGARPYRGHVRWQRPVAWLLAVVMGIGMVALTFTAVYRGVSGQRDEPSQPPATSGVGPTEGSAEQPERVAPGVSP